MRFPNPGHQAAQNAHRTAHRVAQDAHRNAHRMAHQAHQQQVFRGTQTGTRQSAGGCGALVSLVLFLIIIAVIAYVFLHMASFYL